MTATATYRTVTDHRGVTHQWVVEPAADPMDDRWFLRYGHRAQDGTGGWWQAPSLDFDRYQMAIDAMEAHIARIDAPRIVVGESTTWGGCKCQTVMNLTNHLEARSAEWVDGFLPKTAEAKAAWLRFRQDRGMKTATALLTPPSNQPKAGKNATPTYVLHLAPAGASGVQTCSFRTAGCEAACLNTAGRGRFDSVQRGRIFKTEFLAEHPEEFLAILRAEITAAVRRHNGAALFRLNGTSDLRWERFAPMLFEIEGAEFYDYTKYPRRPDLPPNYVVTYSVSERDSDADIVKRAEAFGFVAIVVDTPAPRGGGVKIPLPSTYLGLPAWDGDETDDWRDRPGATLLRAKGEALTDESGFVRKTEAA